MVGNIVAHGPIPAPETCVELSVWPDRLQARVSDDGAPVALPGPPELPGEEATSGRGLPLLEALAAVEFRRDGDCNVWNVVRARGVGPTTLG